MREKRMTLKPFADESTSFAIAGLTLENHIDHISLYGQGIITKDQQGLTQALALQQQLNAIVTALQMVDLPAQIAMQPVVMVDNPFT